MITPYKRLQIGTIISGNKVLYADYVADSPSFSTFLPTALKIIGSLRINESAIEQTPYPIQRSISSGSNNTNSNSTEGSPQQQEPPPSMQAQNSNYKTLTIFTGPIVIPKGLMYPYRFHVPSSSTHVYFKCYVSAYVTLEVW